MNVTVYLSSPAAIRKLAEVMELEQKHAREAYEKNPVISASFSDEPVAATSPAPAAPQTSTTQENPLGNESSVFAAPAKKRGRPPKNAAEGASIEMPNGVVLEQKSVAEITGTAPTSTGSFPTIEKAAEAYVGAFNIAAAKALLVREKVARFGELPEDRKATLIEEMADAIAVGVPAA